MKKSLVLVVLMLASAGSAFGVSANFSYEFDGRMNLQKAYLVLGLPNTATPKEIRHSYRKLHALQYHPDKHAGATKEEYKYYNNRMQEINAAYDYLTKR
ncbi:MAG TPA: J domain-containing protein [Candidatus Babeliales bacterium]|nr:J domain-containing protein [Candidatus Babeliales bacterium]